MPTVLVDETAVAVELSGREKLAALHGDLAVDRRHVTSARVADDLFGEIRGIRAPGLGLPRVAAIGRWRHRSGTDLVVVRRGQRGVVIDLADGAPFRRLVLGVEDPEGLVARLT